MTTPLPTVAIRSLLLSDAVLSNSCGGRISTRLPKDVTQPCIRVRRAGRALALDDRGWALAPMVQVEAWCAPGGPEDAEVVTWRLVMHAKRILGAARGVTYADDDGAVTYTAKVLDAFEPEADVTRGPDSPLYWAFVRAELRLLAA